ERAPVRRAAADARRAGAAGVRLGAQRAGVPRRSSDAGGGAPAPAGVVFGPDARAGRSLVGRRSRPAGAPSARELIGGTWPSRAERPAVCFCLNPSADALGGEERGTGDRAWLGFGCDPEHPNRYLRVEA